MKIYIREAQKLGWNLLSLPLELELKERIYTKCEDRREARSINPYKTPMLEETIYWVTLSCLTMLLYNVYYRCNASFFNPFEPSCSKWPITPPVLPELRPDFCINCEFVSFGRHWTFTLHNRKKKLAPLWCFATNTSTIKLVMI